MCNKLKGKLDRNDEEVHDLTAQTEMLCFRKKFCTTHHGRRRRVSMESLRLEDTAASDPDAAQVFLFSSHPRVVDTIGPVSPAGPTVVRQVRSLKYS